MADMKAIATLAYDLYHGKVAKDFTNGKDPEKQLREALIEANGGSSKSPLDLCEITAENFSP